MMLLTKEDTGESAEHWGIALEECAYWVGDKEEVVTSNDAEREKSMW
jgi:hypothetical protein